MKNIAYGIIGTVLIFMAIPIVGLISDPAEMLRLHWKFYTIAIIIPLLIAFFILLLPRSKK